MAQVTNQTAEKIDWLLDYLFGQWEDLREMATEWDEITNHEREDLWLEWPLKEDALLQLKRYVDQGLLSSAQRKRYDDLQRVIEDMKPEVDRLLSGD